MWYLSNNAAALVDAFEEATVVIAERFETAYETSTALEFGVFVGIVAVVILAAVGLVIPMVVSADKLRAKVLNLFMDVPVVVVRKLRGMARKRLETLHAELDGDEDRDRAMVDMNDDGDDQVWREGCCWGC